MLQSSLRSLSLVSRGKVRDNYAVGGDRLLMVATDRLSAFDVVLGKPIPDKGEVLTQMALFWFAQLAHIVPNHLTGDDPLSVVAEDERDSIDGRAMLVRRLEPLPVEAVVRGYLAGSAWTEYRQGGSVCGIAMAPGLVTASKLAAPIFTPATKAPAGEHDENIDFDRMCELVGSDIAMRVRDFSIRLYTAAAEIALKRGIIIADTKFEFGLDRNGELTLMDEILTPDSSRFWPVDQYVSGTNPPSCDKQFVRDWLSRARIDGKPWDKKAPAPDLPEAVVMKTSARYREALKRLVQPALSSYLRRIDAEIDGATEVFDADVLRARRAAYLARRGDFAAARASLVELRARYRAAPDAAVSAWLNLVEGFLSYYGGTGSHALDKVSRALLLSQLAGPRGPQALASAWLAQLYRARQDVEASARHVREALRLAEPSDHAALARASLVVADAFQIADRMDLAAPWHVRARTHATADGDDVTISALMFNIALQRTAIWRRARLSSSLADRSADNLASTSVDSTESFDDLIGSHGLKESGTLLRAQAFSLLGKAEQAIAMYDTLIRDDSFESASRLKAECLSDIAWCHARLGQLERARRNAEAAESAVTDAMHTDDRAATYSRLALVYELLLETERARHYRQLADEHWREFGAIQHRIVELFEPITEHG